MVRRFWRFGQTKEVTINVVLSDGQKRVMDTLLYKKSKALEFDKIINNSIKVKVDLSRKEFNKQIIKPNFL